jgi:Peroxisomal biogenesis factor 11 (PEX11)
MEKERHHHNESEFPLLKHQTSSTHKGGQIIESRWSDDDSEIESNDENTDNAWLVALSTSSHSSEQSIDSDDDENDVESIPSEFERCNEEINFIKISDIWNNDECTRGRINHSQQQQNHSDHEQNYIFSNLHAIRQIPEQPLRFFVTTKDTIHGYLSFYSEFIAKTKHQEILLKLLQWSLWLVGACIIPSSSSNLLLPQWIQKLSYDICYARYVTRLLGLPVALEGAMSGSWATTCSVHKNPTLDRTYQIIGLVLAYSMVVYYPVEHIAFFLWMNPNAETVMNLPAATWFYISMRCWLVYLVAELIQCIIKYHELQRHQYAIRQSKKTDNQNNESEETYTTADNCSDIDISNDVTPKELNDEMYDVTLLFVRNLFYIAPCFHWSMSTWDSDPLLSDVALNGLMWMEAVICLYQAIHNATYH